jgi:hypothetical protein
MRFNSYWLGICLAFEGAFVTWLHFHVIRRLPSGKAHYGIWDMGYGIWDVGYRIWDMRLLDFMRCRV